jgi:hypothetical protein
VTSYGSAGSSDLPASTSTERLLGPRRSPISPSGGARFNSHCGPGTEHDDSYDPEFRLDYAATPYRCGASPLRCKLARARATASWRAIIGVQRFFVRDDVGAALLPEVSVRECYERNERLRTWTPAQLEQMLDGTQSWDDV